MNTPRADQLGLSLRPLLELLKVEKPDNLTDAEIVRFREWLREAYERAGQEKAEPEPIELVQPEPVKPRAAHPNPEALSAIHARIGWFLANREKQQRAQTEHYGRIVK